MDVKDSNLDIKLMSKLLNADESGRNSAFFDEYNEFCNILENDFFDALIQSSMPDKEQVYRKIKSVSDGMELFRYIPSLLGNTLVGLFGFDKDFSFKCLSKLVGDKTAKNVFKDTNLPCVMINDDTDVVVVNDVGNQLHMGRHEYYRTNKEIWKYNIDISSFLHMFSVPVKLPYAHVDMVYFPKYTHVNEEFNIKLLQKLDVAIIFSSADMEKQKRWIDIKDVLIKRKIPCYVVVDGESKAADNVLENKVNIPDVYGISLDQMLPVMKRFNVPCNNGILCDFIELPLAKIKKFYSDSICEIENNQKLMTNDLVYITMQDTKVNVMELAEQNIKQKRNLEYQYKTIQQTANELREKAKRFEETLQAEIKERKGSLVNRFTQECLVKWSDLFFLYIEMKDFQKAEEYFMKIKNAGCCLDYIYNMILQSVKGNNIDEHDLNRLKNEYDTEFVRRSKMILMKYLGFSEIDYMRIARDIVNLQLPVELYYRGRWEEHEHNLELAADYYKRAMKSGYIPAGNKLMELLPNVSEISLEMLAEEMIPEANYTLGMKYRQRRAKADRYFKLAAAKGHVPSIKILTDNLFSDLNKYDKKEWNGDEESLINNAIRLYCYMAEQNFEKEDCIEKTGDLYHMLSDDIRAADCWKKCKTNTSFYKLGKMYAAPDCVFGQNLDEALINLQRAYELGNNKARTEYNQVMRLKKENDALKKKRNQEERNYASRVVTGSSHTQSSSSWCFITTAVCKTLNKPDDCEELMAFREYRDREKKNDLDMPLLIDEYYRVAPLVVANIDRELNAGELYRDLWINDISEIYDLIRSGKNLQAKLRYIGMVIALCNKYHIELDPRISMIIERKYDVLEIDGGRYGKILSDNG